MLQPVKTDERPKINKLNKTYGALYDPASPDALRHADDCGNTRWHNRGCIATAAAAIIAAIMAAILAANYSGYNCAAGVQRRL